MYAGFAVGHHELLDQCHSSDRALFGLPSWLTTRQNLFVDYFVQRRGREAVHLFNAGHFVEESESTVDVP